VSENIHELIKQHGAFYDVLPYYIVLEERTNSSGETNKIVQEERTKGTRAIKRIQAGFDIDVYGIKPSHEQHPGRDYVLGYVALEKLVETILPQTGESCSVEVIPFPSEVVFDAKRQFQEEGMLRIRITHKGLQPAGKPEERVLKEIKERLHDLGLSQR
jgi:hypothetical protein